MLHEELLPFALTTRFMKFPVHARLKDETVVELNLGGESDVPAVHALYEQIVSEGTSYPHTLPLSRETVEEYWFRGKSTVIAYLKEALPARRVLGAFYLKPNWPGRARLVANAGFIVAPDWRNKGLGYVLGATMIDYARTLGYRSVIFNLVFSQNHVARALWTRLGFRELGCIPEAVRNDDGSFQDAVIMFRSLS